MTNKRFYWIKLRTDFFNQDTIDFLLSQKNGCEYVVLYQMLCLNTVNTNGQLVNQIGEMIIPYDVPKIVRDTKYFDHDTVVVAMELYRKLGLIFESETGALAISNYQHMVGSEAANANAQRQKRFREKQKETLLEVSSVTKSNARSNVESITKSNVENRDKDIRDKSIENRDKDKEFICLIDKQINSIVASMNEKQKTVYRDFFEIEPFIDIPIKNGSIQISEEMLVAWGEKYPNVCVEHELQEIRTWLKANGSKMTTTRTLDFIERWLSKHQKEDTLTEQELSVLHESKEKQREEYERSKNRRDWFFENMHDEKWLNEFLK